MQQEEQPANTEVTDDDAAVSQQTRLPELEIKVGDILCAKYEVVGQLSQHGGNSYLCRRLTPPYRGEMARVKLFSPNKLGEEDRAAAARFQHEIVATISVRHPNVVRVDQTVKHEGYLGFVAEFLNGRTLEDHLEEHSALPVEQAVTILRQLCAGVEAIHSAGIIHRSLKPRNVLLTPEGHVKIIDFGLAKIVGQKVLTKAGVRLGTVDYMSPEYITENISSPMTDIYALGVIGYRLLTGELPLWAEDPLQMMSLRVQGVAEPVHTLNPDCPAELSFIIAKALQRNPEARYQRAREMQLDLERLPEIGANELPKPPKPRIYQKLSTIFSPDPEVKAGKSGWLSRLFGR